ncbi:hypothetical protein HPB52_011431 [Rhipicephalus sanguineus]|uniref:Uncharacterized protein n=1 Tax=Rhipicephalus sanguineus TaxID=34632 RepID=A0A9D4SPM1_RHISA|nr:hypothetical protein HPB52_011431 [Rhipicephalus sanguineus]
MSSSNVEGVRRYFTDQEWMKLPDYMKVRYGNIKENYDKMVALGLQPPIPEFMDAKPAARNAPAKPNSCRYGCSHEDPSECPVHGPSFYVRGVPLEDFELAKKKMPKGLAVLRSKIKGAQLGIFAVEPLAEGHCFGPYAHSSAKPNISQAADEEEGEREPPKTGEAGPEIARWICYVNCAPSEHQCNLVVIQQAGLVYYQTCQPLEQSAELMVWCGIINSVAPLGLDRHLAIHASVKPFKCEECAESFTKAVLLKRHKKRHTGALMYKCPECGREFGMVTHFKSHVQSHAGLKPYSCRVCGRAFARKCHWSRHEILMHGKR